MKAIKILFLSVFLIFLVNTVSAVVVYGEWNDNNAQSIEIEDGDSVDFGAFFGTISPPMTISVKLYDSGNDLIHTFEDTVVNQRSFAQTYTVNQAIYSRPGDFQVRILGSDNFGDMSTVLYLDVINYPPEITSEPVREVDENDFYEYQVVAEDLDGHTLTYSFSVAPAWLSINFQTGLITGMAPEVDADTYFDVSVDVSDGTDIDTQSYVLTVIWVPNPFLSQTVELVDDINIEYHATLSELDSAILEIYYDTELIETRDITASPYDEIFDFYDIRGITKGDYRFILEAVGYDLNKINDIDIPDYAPMVGSIPNEDFNEEDSIEINLPDPEDINPEDNPVAYLSAISLDGKTTTSVTSNGLLTLTGNRDQTGYYQVELEFGDPDGETATAILNGYIYNLPDISGILEDNEEDLREQGVIRVYYINPVNASDYLPLEIDRIYEGSIINANLGKIQTTSDGTFNFQINKKASELEIIILQARIGGPGDYTSYVRTIELSGDDNLDVLVRAVPYAPYEDDPIIFRQFMTELTGDRPSTRFDLEGEYLAEFPDFENYTGLIGIEILSENPFGAENGTFTIEQQNNIKSKILNSTDISGIIGNYSISEEQVSIVNGSDGHFIFYEYHVNPKVRVVADPGWIIVVPYLNMPYSGLAEPRKAGGIIGYGGTVYLRPLLGGTYIHNGTISHEFGHIFIGGDLNQSTSMPSNQSVMIAGTPLSTTGPADKKVGKLIYEQTYMTFPPLFYPRVDYLYKILGLGFYGESQITGTIIGSPFEDEDDNSDDDNFVGGQQDSDGDNVIDFDNTGSFNGVNADLLYDGTIYLQSNADENNIITSLSNIIRQVISFISQKLRSVFSI
ncbi:hypothetical protein ES703_27251 [subsurface metagenome]